MGQKNQPPRWAQRFLGWYCRPQLLEDLQGDLDEYFHRNVIAKGLFKARLTYVLDVLKFFRSYTVRKPEIVNLFIHWMMMRSYIRTSGRNMIRSKLFTAINVVGLAVSISVGLVAIAFVTELMSYDNFHVNKDRIYRIYDSRDGYGDFHMEMASTSLKAGKLIKESLSGVEQVVMIRNGFDRDAIVEAKSIPVSGFWANEPFFKVFSFPMIHGDANTALLDPYTVVLTEKTANKLFGETDVVGKVIKFDTANYTVTGVMKDVPHNSHMSFELLVSMATAESRMEDPSLLNWEHIWSAYVYILLPPDANLKTIQAGLDKISAAENSQLKKGEIRLFLQDMNDVWMGRKLGNQIGKVMHPLVLWIAGGFAFVIILSACFNYTNLSIARSLKRTREVGIRRVIGAFKSHIIFQFITESVLTSMVSLIIAIPLFLFCRAQFTSLDPHVADLVTLDLNPKIILLFLALTICVGIMAGLLPALFFSKINAIQVLKNLSSVKLFRRVSLRKALIVVQYTVSLIFISTVVIGYGQYKGFLTYDLGFRTNNIINLRLQGNDGDRIVNQLKEIPAVSKISRSLMVTSLGSVHGTTMKYKDPNDSTMVVMNIVDENYLPIHGHKLVAGVTLQPHATGAKESEILVNEQTLNRFKIANGDAQKALGETVKVDGNELTIVGVLKDFHYGTTENKIEPAMFRYSPKPDGYINILVNSSDLPGTMEQIEKVWKSVDSVHSMDAKFYDDQIQQAYSQFSVMLKVLGFIAFLAICISSLGLFGMVVFTGETRLKEVSIRKVLGATEGTLVMLLSGGFLGLLAIATIIAIPVTWLFFQNVVLVNFAYHSPISFIQLLIGPAIVILLSFMMIGSQTIKVAGTNPADILKNE